MIKRFKEIREQIDYILDYDVQGEEDYDPYTLKDELDSLEQELIDYEGLVSGREESSRKICLNIINQIRDVYDLDEYL